MIKRIAHLCFTVADLEASRYFYCDVMGLKQAFDFVRDGKVVGFYLDAGSGNFLEFFKTGEKKTGESAIAHFCLEVDCIDEMREKFIKAGIPVSEKSMGADHSYQAWITDPDGVQIELHEYTPESCQYTHKPCILK